MIYLSLISKYLIEIGQKRSIKIAAGCCIAFYIVYHLTKFHISNVWPPVLRGDGAILFTYSQAVTQSGAYPAEKIFPYSPSAVLIFHCLAIPGPAGFMVIWYLLIVAGLILVIRASVLQERDKVQAAWLLIGSIALLFASSPISWDLRNVNSSLVYLGLVMAGYALLPLLPMASGIAIGMSISLKLYSGLLVLWLLIHRQDRAAAAALSTIFILWLVLPTALFGLDGSMALYADWKRQLETISDPSVHAILASNPGGPPLVSLQRAIVNATGAAFGSTKMYALLFVLRLLWLCLLLVYLWRRRDNSPKLVAHSRAMLADWTVLLLVPLPFSPWLEPYHCVPLYIASILLLIIVLDPATSNNHRLVTLISLATMTLLAFIKPPFEYRGFSLGAQLAISVLILGFLRPGMNTKPESTNAHWSTENS